MIKPEYVAPVVAYLCHDDCSETGAVFEAAGGWASKGSSLHTQLPYLYLTRFN
jgi:hypothetical protein